MQGSNYLMGGLMASKSNTGSVFGTGTSDDKSTTVRKFHHSIRKVAKSVENGATTNEVVEKFLIESNCKHELNTSTILPFPK